MDRLLVDWITGQDTTPESKEFWSHNGEDDWQTAFELIDQDQMFFEEDDTSVVYKSDGEKMIAANLLDNEVIETILDLIMRSGHESREIHDHYIPDYWLEDFISQQETKNSMKALLAKWLEDNGQTDYYTMRNSVEVPVKRVGDELIEIATKPIR